MMPQPLVTKLWQVHLKSLYLRNFRNYKEAEVQFSPTINIFCGENAQGKTNLLEAIYFIATGRSFRTQTHSELIREKEEFLFLGAEIIKDGVLQEVKITLTPKTKKLQLDANTYTSLYPLLGLLPSVLYTPYDIELITGAPVERRRFLNMHLAQSDPLYIHHLSRFHQAMKQRNVLLRRKSQESLDCWEIEMAQSADYLVKARAQMIQEINTPLAQSSQMLTINLEAHQLSYLPSQSRNYLEQLRKNRHKEMELGITLTGPHRDDLTLLIDQKAAKLFASEGQKKTLIASIKLAEWQLLSKQTGTFAIFGVDDLGLHLDETRQRLFQEALTNLSQVFITTPQKWEGAGHMSYIQNGSFTRNEIGSCPS